jgi:type I restriction enzyme S subunit
MVSGATAKIEIASVAPTAPAITEGYKQTDVGVIPEDWVVEKLELFLSFISYGFTNPMPTSADGIYMITATDIVDGKIQYTNARHTTEHAYKSLLSSKSKPKRNDILLTKDGTLGRLALVDDNFLCINQSVAVLRPNNRISPIFLKKLLESSNYQKTMLDNAGGSTIKHIYITIVNLMLIAVPESIEEQEAIAGALSDADALIESLESLIAKKRNIKQGAMQELLTGTTRLAGFSGEWEQKRLGDLAKEITRGASPRPIEDPIWFEETSSIGWVRISDITKTGRYLTETTQRLSPLGLANSRFVPKGSLIMSICATVGKPIETMIDVCIHDGFVVFNKINVIQEFLFHTLKDLEKHWAGKGQTGSQMNLNTDIIKGATILLPQDPKEQAAIANILSDMDAEIENLEVKLEKAKQVKQGMMQELLTGKIRLI